MAKSNTLLIKLVSFRRTGLLLTGHQEESAEDHEKIELKKYDPPRWRGKHVVFAKSKIK